MQKVQLKHKYSMLTRMIKDILSVFVTDIEVKRFFNQHCDIFHYRRKRLQTKIIKTLMILHIHTNTNDSKSNKRYSKDESENDHRDIDVFVKTNLQKEFYVTFDYDSDNLMEKSTILNKNKEFENNKFDDLKTKILIIFS